VFELSPLGDVNSFASSMHGIDKRFDGHVWTITKTFNIKNQFGLVLCKSLCVGHLRCENELCAHFLRKSSKVKTKWDGPTILQFSMRCFFLEKSIIFHYKVVPSCVATYAACIYYIFPKNVLMSYACIHFGLHNHLVAKGNCRESMEVVKILIADEVM
jgi:hypothetical protein